MDSWDFLVIKTQNSGAKYLFMSISLFVYVFHNNDGVNNLLGSIIFSVLEKVSLQVSTASACDIRRQ